MHFIVWDTDTNNEISAEPETEEVQLAQSILDEARISYAYARLAVLIDAVASYNPGHHASTPGSARPHA